MMVSTYSQVTDLLRPYRKEIFLAILLSLLPAYFSVWSPYIVGLIIDRAVLVHDSKMLIQLSLVMLFVQLAHFLSKVFVNYSLVSFGLRILVDYRSSLLRRVLAYKIDFFDKIPSGRLSTRLTSDVNAVQELFSQALVVLIGNCFMLIGVSTAMLIINWKLAMAVFIMLPVMIGVTKFFHQRIRRRFGFMRKSLSNMNAVLGESLRGARDIRGLGVNAHSRKEFERYSNKLKEKHRRAAFEFMTYNPSIAFLNFLMTAFVLVLGSFLVYYDNLSVGGVAAFLAYVNFFSWPIQELSEKFSVLQQALASVDRLVEISQHEPEPDHGEEEFGDFSELSFQNISFSYNKASSPALSNVDFKVTRGEKIALLGETGSGKSTTCSLIMRLYEPDSGKILFDGQEASSFDLNSFRRSIGWVSQDVTLFSNSLRENIRFFDLSIQDHQIWEILELVQLKDWASDLDKGLDTVLNEGATIISTGQRQLLSIARAIVRDPKILIMDEATSYVDSQTEWVVQQALEQLWGSGRLKGVTCFIVAHRLSTLRKCDRMLVFREGQIVERGTYKELIDLDGYAASLYRRQFRQTA